MKLSKLSVPIVYVRLLVEELESQQIGVSGWLKPFGIRRESLDTTEQTLSHDVYTALVTHILRKVDIPGLGLKVGERFNHLELGLLGYALSCCKTLGHIFKVDQYFSPLANRPLPGILQVRGHLAVYTMDTTQLRYSPSLLRYELEKEFVIWLRSARFWQSPSDWFSEVRFSFSAPSDASSYEQVFRCPIKYNQPRDEFVFNADDLDARLIGRHDQIRQAGQNRPPNAIGHSIKKGGLSGEIREILLICGSLYPSFEQLSQRLHMSPATLRRNLLKERTSYRQLLREFRLEIATHFLAESELSAAEIAYLISYNDPACFSRAFKQVYRQTPLQYREHASTHAC